MFFSGLLDVLKIFWFGFFFWLVGCFLGGYVFLQIFGFLFLYFLKIM